MSHCLLHAWYYVRQVRTMKEVLRCHVTKPCAVQGATTQTLRASATAPTIILCTLRFVHLRYPHQRRGTASVDTPKPSSPVQGQCTLSLHTRHWAPSHLKTVGYTSEERHSLITLIQCPLQSGSCLRNARPRAETLSVSRLRISKPFTSPKRHSGSELRVVLGTPSPPPLQGGRSCTKH